MTLIILAVAWLVGILLAKAYAPIPWQVFPLVGLTAFITLVIRRDNARIRRSALCVLVLALGAMRMWLTLPRLGPTSLATYNDIGPVTLEGIVIEEPDEREAYTNLRVQSERLILPDGTELAVEGLVLVKAAPYPRHTYGDRVVVTGRLETPPAFDTFSYRDYLARQGVYSLVRHAEVTRIARNQASPLRAGLLAFKSYARSTIAHILPEPQAALLTGILLGVETGIPASLLADFAATGTTHVIAISGFNITIVASNLIALTRRLFGQPSATYRPTWKATLTAMAGVALYTVLVGGSAAVVRAAILGILTLLARRLGRPAYAPTTLAAAAIGMTAWNPHLLWDVGFQLSFAATAGLVVYAEPIERLFKGILTRFVHVELPAWLDGLIQEALFLTLAAQLTTTPILAYYFGQLSIITLVTNFLILPAQPGVMLTGGCATLLGLVARPLGQAAGWLAWVFLTYTIQVVELTAQIPRASVPVSMSGWMVGAYYAALGSITWWFARPQERRAALRAWLDDGIRTLRLRAEQVLRQRPLLPVLAAAILLALGYGAWRGLPDGRLHVVFLDVGQGDGIFIQTPSGRQILVDGGPSAAALLAQLGRQMPFWDRTLDVVILTHPDDDHVTGLIPVLERYRVDTIVFHPTEIDSATYDRWLEVVEEEQATVVEGQAGLRLTLDEGLEMAVLHPGAVGTVREPPLQGDVNDNSVVARLTYGSVSFLLPGDVGAEVERELVRAYSDSFLQSTVLKAPHHGSCTSTSQPFLEAVAPQVVVISVGADNRFGHPCEEVLERLGETPVYRTDEHGAVEIVTDGARVWVEVEELL